MNREHWQGAIVSFYAEPNKSVINSIPQKGAVRVAGQVIGTFPAPAYGPGRVPEVGLIVRARSGRKVRIGVTEHYVRVVASYLEADGENNRD